MSVKEHLEKYFLAYLAVLAAIVSLLVIDNSRLSVLHFIPVWLIVMAVDELGSVQSRNNESSPKAEEIAAKK